MEGVRKRELKKMFNSLIIINFSELIRFKRADYKLVYLR